EGRARVQDFAWLEAGALVRDAAVVRDYAWVRRGAQVEGEARVEEFGRLDENAVASGRARVREMGALDSRQRIEGTAILEGLTEQGNWMGGNALADGNLYDGKDELQSGVRLAAPMAGDEALETEGRVLDYQFERGHPFLAWDTHGVNHAFLEGSPRQVDGGGGRGQVLAFDGEQDGLRLPHGALDLTDMHLSLSVWPTSARSMPLLTGLGLGAGTTTKLELDTRLRLLLETPEGSVRLAAPRPLAPQRWSTVSIDFSGERVALAVDGVEVASAETPLDPEDVHATTVLFGRDGRNGAFSGSLDDLRLYRASKVDDTPPQPDPAAWDSNLPPRATGASSISMRAGRVLEFGRDGRVEYQFEVLEGASTRLRSEWQSGGTYKATGLDAATLYACRFRARDRSGNTGAWSPTQPVVTLAHEPRAIRQPAEPSEIGFVFEAEDSLRRAPGSSGARWESIRESPWWTDHELSGSALRATPGQERPDRPFERPELGGLLEYVLHFERPGEYRMTLLGGGEDAKQNSLSGTFDYAPLRTFEHISVKEGQFKWFARAIATKSFVTFEVPTPGPYVLQLRAREAGTLIDRVQIQEASLERRFPPAGHPAVASTGGSRDASAPDPPADVSLSTDRRQITWSPSQAPDVVGYRIYREAEGGGWDVVAASAGEDATDWRLPEDPLESRLAIGAIDEAGNLGPLIVVRP
ncbi:MAG: LamG-like jellyroll fold domain-containing protein, partial [Planctomycetota bacterium]